MALLSNLLASIRSRWRTFGIIILLFSALTQFGVLFLSHHRPKYSLQQDIVSVQHIPEIPSGLIGVDSSQPINRPTQHIGLPYSAIEKSMELRKEIYQEKCSHVFPDGVPSHIKAEITISRKHKFLLCYGAKAGATFWRRVVRWLEMKDPEKQNLSNPFDIDRFSAHYGNVNYVSAQYNSEELNGTDFHDFLKALFTRDPYQRLWSAYLDKFFLPEFWCNHGEAILRVKVKTNSSSSICADSVSFEDFLKYTNWLKDEPHWRPVSDVCNPCIIKPDIVGKMESFVQDRDYFLRKINHSQIIHQHHRDHTTREITMLIDYNFKLRDDGKCIEKCITSLQLAKRLWSVFQWNGYIRDTAAFPFSELMEDIQGNDSLNGDYVTELFLRQILKDPLSHSEGIFQRKTALRNAWKNVSQKTKEQIKLRFQKDFELFGYNAAPPI